MADAITTWNTVCTSCHGTSGAGDGPAAAGLKAAGFTVADLRKSTLTDAQLLEKIKLGGQAPGSKAGSPMPPSPALTATELGDLVKYIRTTVQAPAK